MRKHAVLAVSCALYCISHAGAAERIGLRQCGVGRAEDEKHAAREQRESDKAADVATERRLHGHFTKILLANCAP